MNKKELRQLSKNQLIEIILRQEERLAQVERLHGSFNNPHTPSSKERHKQNTVQDETSMRRDGQNGYVWNVCTESYCLLGVKLPYVSLTNNRAERSLRKVVLHRNRIGCIRNNKGKEFINTFLTCTSTWRLQGQNVYQNLLAYSS